MVLYIYKISQTENRGYDTYSACIVCAENARVAALITPCSDYHGRTNWKDSAWASRPENVTVKLLGTAAEGLEAGMILDSFHAG